ncbi:MAG: HEAT repeat domain-containing protein [Candidatus Hodarchaeota archaeon]
MSRDFKDLIDSAEKETRSYDELEKTINSLKEEINRLEFTEKEQKKLIENLKSQLKDEQIEKVELPSEIEILKDMVTSQRRELEKKDNEIDKLNKKVDELNQIMEGSETFKSVEIENEEFIKAQNLIVQLVDENEQLKNQVEDLKGQLEETQFETSNFEEISEDKAQTEENEELINLKRLNFQLMEQNGLLRVEIESLRAKLQERLEEASSEELKLANEKIIILTTEIENYKSKIKFLQNQLDNISKSIMVSTEEALKFAEMREEYNKLKSDLLTYQQENKILNERLNEIEEQKQDVYSDSIAKDMPKIIPRSIFNRMYKLLDDNNKKEVIDLLIQDLKSKNAEIKRNAIKILSQIKEDKIYDAFLEIIDDKDWIIRYSLIKALSKFEKRSDEFKFLLKKFAKDVDVDVRELALKILNDISN